MDGCKVGWLDVEKDRKDRWTDETENRQMVRMVRWRCGCRTSEVVKRAEGRRILLDRWGIYSQITTGWMLDY